MGSKRIKVDWLARVEGEGAIDVEVEDGQVTRVQFAIFEPPRLFEAFLVGRTPDEVLDFVPRICGICPVAYQMSAAHAIEYAFGITVEGQLRALRRLLYCGEWIESHTLHVLMLAAPDFLGYDSVIGLAQDYPQQAHEALELKRLGNDIVETMGGREIHPVSVRTGGFYRVPTPGELRPLGERLRSARAWAERLVQWVAKLDLPAFPRDIEFVSLRHPDEYPMNEGRVVSSRGLDISMHEYDRYFEEIQVPYSTALQSVIRGRGAYFVGPLARVNLSFDRLCPQAQAAAAATGISFPSSNPFHSIVARALEVLHCVVEAEQIIASYQQPAEPYVRFSPRAAAGEAITEAPRGMLYHRYQFDEHGYVQSARIVPPTAQNQRQIEDDLRHYVPRVINLPLEQATRRAEAAVRNYDPCISCSTHLLRLSNKAVQKLQPFHSP